MSKILSNLQSGSKNWQIKCKHFIIEDGTVFEVLFSICIHTCYHENNFGKQMLIVFLYTRRRKLNSLAKL